MLGKAPPKPLYKPNSNHPPSTIAPITSQQGSSLNLSAVISTLNEYPLIWWAHLKPLLGDNLLLPSSILLISEDPVVCLRSRQDSHTSSKTPLSAYPRDPSFDRTDNCSPCYHSWEIWHITINWGWSLQGQSWRWSHPWRGSNSRRIPNLGTSYQDIRNLLCQHI